MSSRGLDFRWKQEKVLLRAKPREEEVDDIDIQAGSQHLLVQRELWNSEARAEGGDISHPNTFLNITRREYC
jgi:hypothetical protein